MPLDRAPPEGAYLRLPESFGRRFIIFVDTEEEFDWGKPLARENRATTAMAALPEAHRRLREAGAKPVYLIDHPIATDPASIAILRPWLAEGSCTIGTQLHPWVNPPFEEEVSQRNSYTGNLPIDLQRAKLRVLTEAIEEGFGARPIVYRAGRYGIGSHTAELLQAEGYRADVSVRALYDYSPGEGPNFARVKPLPYWAGDGRLLELPLTAGFTGMLHRSGATLYPAAAKLPLGTSLLSRAGLLQRVALSPEDMPLGEVLEALRILVDQDLQVFSISFHSPTVAPGFTPYVRDAADLAQFYAWWDGVFDFFARHGVSAASFEQILDAAEAARGLPSVAPVRIGARGL